MLDSKTLAAITKQVQRQFPEFIGIKPNVRVQNPPSAKSPSATQENSTPLYLVTFRGTATTPDGKSIPRLVRVVVNAEGKVIKITTSR